VYSSLEFQVAPTANRFGWLGHTSDPLTQKFLGACEQSASPTILEIGAGDGSVSLEALKKGAIVWVNDLEMAHLKDFSHKVPQNVSNQYTLVTGDFPSEINLPTSHFDMILLARVLHFFDPPKLETAIARIFTLLKPGGKVFVLAATPYSHDWKSFTAEYEKQKKNGELYPGYTKNFSRYTSNFKSQVPETMHFLDPVVLRREFEKTGFIVIEANFLQQKNFWRGELSQDFSLVELIALKPLHVDEKH
jgi:ubiquinone/menaquinone biosynthesis C-methylase UbiE